MNESYITVMATTDLGDLAIAKSILTDANIEFVVQNENFGSIYNGFYSLTGFIEIQVHQDQLEIARKLLEKLIKDIK